MDIDKKRIESSMCEMLTLYRLVPIMAYLVGKGAKSNDTIAKAGWQTLVSEFRSWFKSDLEQEHDAVEEILKQFLADNKAWIQYVLMDMAFYANKISDSAGTTNAKTLELMREDAYLERMREQQKFLSWDTNAFYMPLVGCEHETDPKRVLRTLLDIGCGYVPYADLFGKANPDRIATYYGIDKRYVKDSIDFASLQNTFDLRIIKADVTDPVSDDQWKDRRPSVLFFGESLHCFSGPLTWLNHFIKKMSSVKIVMILELDNKAELGCGFDFHMLMHSGTRTITAEDMSYFAMELSAELLTMRASSQHIMYKLVLHE
ncbi:MAG: hypothetical protein FVQ80_11540 [Planctomycetes bacterium]|nr:hypothetical protein [Planctomycetota bacterium]